MDEPLDELYFKWLYRQVSSPRLRNPARTYWSLLRQLFRKEFVWLVPNDDNRVEDGRDLRYEFLDGNGVDRDHEWLSVECSMLEMLIGLSRRLAFEAEEGEPRDWFWTMLENVDLRQYSDAYYDRSSSASDREVNYILERVIWRHYERDGSGGLFPLNAARQDQRKVELWYQSAAFLLERY
jgi:hypothetical protein